jgi:hypothetical protein
MDEYYDDGYADEDEYEIDQFQKKLGKFKTNPKGPFKFKMTFKGVNWEIKIENVDMNDFKVTAKSNVKVDLDELEIIKRYLRDEGFEQAARKHNLYW